MWFAALLVFCFALILSKITLRGLEMVRHIQLYTKKVASVARAMWHSRVQRLIEAKIWLSGLGAAANQRHPASLPQVGRSYVGNQRKEKEPFLRFSGNMHLIPGAYLIVVHLHHTLR